MVHYQAAFKLTPQDVRPLERARRIYWEMGNLDRVATLLGLELKVTEDAQRRAELQSLLGIALLDSGKRDDAVQYLEAAVEAHPQDQDAADALAAANYDREDWLSEVERLEKHAQSTDSYLAARIYLRVARIYRLEGVTDKAYIDVLQKVVANEPQHQQANFLLEAALAGEKQFDELVAVQEKRAFACPDDRERSDLYRHFAAMWALRWNDAERSAHFYRRALETFYADGQGIAFPGHLAAFAFVRQIDGPRGHWRRLVDLAEMGLRSPMESDEQGMLATQAATIAWQELKDNARAQVFFAQVEKVFPDSEDLRTFRAENGSNGHIAKDAAADSAKAADSAAEPAKKEKAPRTRKSTQETKKEREALAKKAAEEAAAAAAPAAGTAPPPAAEAPAAAAAPPVAEAPAAAPAPVATAAPATPTATADAPTGRVETVDDATKQAMDAAKALEASSDGKGVDKAIEAWRKIIAASPNLRGPRRELARLYRQVERWNALIELLKEEAEKLADATVDEKIATMFEMVTLYKERLKLDVMVANTYNAILALRPTETRALDALATQYEGMKRWPDLIGVLQKKAATLTAPAERVELHARIAGLFQEKFSNVAEAIKEYEKVLELDPGNATAIAYLKTNYEKRRDWEKLIAVHQRETERLADPVERGKKYIEIAKLASEKLKKPSVSIELWQKVREADSDNLEALGELEKLYEREKLWDKLAEVCETQARLLDDQAKKVAMLQKLGLLFTDKVNDVDRATVAWRQLLDLEPENKRAQDALKKLYLAQKNYDELEKFYATQGKYDEYIRVLERQAETEDDASKVSLNIKIAELYRDRMQKADRAMRAYEKVLTLDAENLISAKALIPLYEAAKDARKLAGVLEIELRHTTDKLERVEKMRRLGSLSEQQLKDKSGGVRLVAPGVCPPSPRPIGPARTSSAWRKRPAAGPSWSARTRPFTASWGRRRCRRCSCWWWRASTRASLHEAQAALSANQAILKIDENEPHAIAALERLYLQTEQYAALLGIYQKKLSLEKDAHAQKEIRYKLLASIFEMEIKDNAKAIAAYRDILADHGDELPAYRALDRIYIATQQWKELAEVIQRELGLLPIDDHAGQVELKFRLGSLLELHLNDKRGAIDQFRDILALQPDHPGARLALESKLTDADLQLSVAAILEPIYQQLEEWARLVQVYEIQLAREKAPSTRGDLLLRIGELHAHKLGDGEKAFDAYARAFGEDPASATARTELERLATINEAWPRLVTLYEQAIEKLGQGDKGDKTKSAPAAPALLRELLMKAAEAYDEKLEKADKAVEYYKRAQALEPDDLTAIEALERLHTRNERWPELLEVYRKKVELTHDAKEREQIFFRMAYLWEDMLQNVDEAIGTYNEVLQQDPSNIKALKSLDRLHLAQKQWHALADNLTRQLQLTDANSETIELLGRLAALREKELGEVAAAVDTYRQVLDLDANNDAASSALERLVQLPEHELQVATILEPIYKARNNWPKLVDTYEILVRHSFDPARKIELLHQIGELYEEAGDDGAKAFSTYDRALREEPGLKETQTRLERLARQLERWKDLVRLYQSVARAGAEVDRRSRAADASSPHAGGAGRGAAAPRR